MTLLTTEGDRKSTRLNSSHLRISYAVFCLKKKKKYALPIRSDEHTSELHEHQNRRVTRPRTRHLDLVFILTLLFFCILFFFFFFLNDTAPPEIYPLPLHDALPILPFDSRKLSSIGDESKWSSIEFFPLPVDRKSTRLNSSHLRISYAVFCLKK